MTENEERPGRHRLPDAGVRTGLFESLAAPPFPLLPLVVWLYVLLRFLVHPGAPVVTGKLPDADDYMYIVDMFNWLDEGGWFRHLLTRLDPPDGTVMHFSRLPELPLAAATWFFGLVADSRQHAAFLAAAVLPPLYFGLFLFVLGWLLRPLTGRRYAAIGGLILIFSQSPAVLLFQPGRIDHHGLQILLMGLALGAVTRWLKDEKGAWLVLTAAAFSLSLWIGLETLPWIAAMGGFVLTAAAARGGAAAVSLKGFAVALGAGALTVMGLSREPALWLTADTTAFSIVYAVFLLAMAFGGFLLAALANRKPRVRLSALAIAGLAGVSAFLILFPDMLKGPFGSVTGGQTDEILGITSESTPWFRLGAGWKEALFLLFMPGFGLIIALWQGFSRHKQRVFWAFYALLLLFSLALSLFYQSRTEWFAALFALPPLTWLAVRGQKLLARAFRRRPGPALALTLGFVFVFFAGVIVSGQEASGIQGSGAKKISRTEEYALLLRRRAACDPEPVAALLNGPGRLGNRPLRIMVPMDDGAEFLFLTLPGRHSVFAAPYHNVRKGNRLARLFFRASREEDARRIAEEQAVDIVALCENFPPLYRLRPDADPLRTGPGNGFASDIVNGRVPAWLENVPLPAPTRYKVFAVKRGWQGT